MVDAVNGTDYSKLGLGVPQNTAKKSELGQKDFMTLMMTQLKNQDPFKPLDSGAFLGQLAQFGTVSGLAGLQTSFDSLKTSLVSNQALQAASLVGRSALVEASTMAVGSGQPVAGAVDLPDSTSSLTVTVRDSTGQVVRTLPLGANAKGEAPFVWDGMTDSRRRRAGRNVHVRRGVPLRQHRRDRHHFAGRVDRQRKTRHRRLQRRAARYRRKAVLVRAEIRSATNEFTYRGNPPCHLQ